MADENQQVTDSSEVSATTPATSDLENGQVPAITEADGASPYVKTTTERNPLDDWGSRAGDTKVTDEAEKPSDDKKAAETPEGAKDESKTAEKPAEGSEKVPEDKKTDEDEVLEELFAEDAGEKPKTDEKKTEEVDLDKLNPEEQITLQRNKTAKAWASRRDNLAKVLDTFRFEDKPLEDFQRGLEELNPARYQEFRQALAHSLVDENPEATFQRAYVMVKRSKDPSYDYTKDTLPTLESVISGTPPAAQAAAPAASPEEIKAMTADLDKVIDFDWRDPKNDGEFLDDRELAMVKAIRSLSERAASAPAAKPEDEAKATELESKLQAAEARLKELEGTVQTKEQLAFQSDLESEINTFRSSVETKLLPHIYKSTGIAVNADDTPEIAAFKKGLQEIYAGTDFERETGSSTQFEIYAFHQSDVKQQLQDNASEIAAAITRLVTARHKNDKAAAEKAESDLKDARLTSFTLLAEANRSFNKLKIEPAMRMIGMNAEKAVKEIQKQAERVEVTDGGGSPPKPKKKEYATADDVWGSMGSDAENDATLRTAA